MSTNGTNMTFVIFRTTVPQQLIRSKYTSIGTEIDYFTFYTERDNSLILSQITADN